MIYHDGPAVRLAPASPNLVGQLNLLTIEAADQEVYSRDEYLEAYNWMKGLVRPS